MPTLTTYSRCSTRRQAFTLIEIVAGLTLLATLAVGVMLAFGVHQRQVRAARHRLEATALADRLLSDWYASSREIPRDTRGFFPEHRGWSWTTRWVERGFVATLPVDVVRLQVFRQSASAQPPEELATVELMVPVRPVFVPQQRLVR